MNTTPQTVAAQKPRPLDFIDAIQRGDMDEMKDLLARGLDPDAVAPYEDIPVLAAIMRGQPDQKIDIIKLLIAYGADMEIRREGYEWTPLMQAVNNHQAAIVSLLIAQGVDLDKKDYEGRTAFDIAEEHDESEIADMLKSAMAERSARAAAEQVRLAEQARHETVVAKQRQLQKKQPQFVLRRTI